MNSNRYSNLALAFLLVAVVAVAPVAAVSVSDADVPSTIEVDEKQDAVTYTITDPFSEFEEWTLAGETELEQVSWQVTTYNNAGNQIDEKTFTSQSFEYPLQAQDGVVRVEVRLVGTTPEVSNWSYAPPQKITYATLNQQVGDSTSELTTDAARPYTQESQSARTAIDEAQTAIQDASEAGADTAEAESLLESAISAYDNANFENAEKLAGDARESAQSAQQSTQQTNTLLMVGAGVVVVLVLAGIGYWYLQQRETYDKLG